MSSGASVVLHGLYPQQLCLNDTGPMLQAELAHSRITVRPTDKGSADTHPMFMISSV